MSRPVVSVVIPTVLTRSDFLTRAVESLPSGDDVEILLVVDRSQDEVEPSSLPSVSGILWTGGRAGFAGAAQSGIEAARAPYVFLLNDDAWLESEESLLVLLEELEADAHLAGVAPKVRFSRWPEVLNSVGIFLRADGWADSRGIGQPDVGQYDARDRVFGCHFAGALLRRKLFDPRAVGGLDARYGLYYEDVDWCLRANLLGYTFLTVPEVCVVHAHSTSTRERSEALVFALQERNRLWTVLTGFGGRRAVRVAGRRLGAHARSLFRSDGYRSARMRILRDTLEAGPWLYRKRARVQASRVIPDSEVFALSVDERSWFDQTEGPVLTLANLVNAVRRGGDPGLADAIGEAAQGRAWERVDSLVSSMPPRGRRFWERIRPSVAGS